MSYVGEHTWVGDLGRLMVALSFVWATFSSVAYALHLRRPQSHWLATARWSFRLHALAVVGIVAVLFVAIWNHWFEFDYVWRHSSTDLPLRYIFSCFWEGQEGSFLLWTFWQAVLGWILIHKSREWEAGVMLTVAAVQAFLSSMLLGVYVFGIKLGSSPFVLIRDLPENLGLPWTQMADYLTSFPAFQEGNGLNPLLQNWWMTIHPPTLFLGFALTVVPFAYAVAGLLTKRYSDWVKPALSWTFAGVAVLGVGILMGGAWAYEALSFGGFWAWDPVENASLVPWLTLVAAGHLMMVEKHKHSATGITLFMALFTFWLVLYSTFLTRSGVLGDSSVHSFVDLGLSGQLLVYLLFFVLGTAALLAIRWKSFPKNATDELLGSREFWMFIGSITLLLSALQIAFSTSLPVFNKMIGPDGWIPLLGHALAPPNNANEHYNRLQMPFAIVVSVLMAVGPFLVWRSNSPLFWKRILPAAAGSVVLGGLIAWGMTIQHPVHVVLLVVSLFSALANVDLWLRLWRGNSRHLGMTTAHVGFALVLLGSLISQGKKEFLSVNKSFIHKDFPANENSVLELKDTVSMVPYWVTWTGERSEGQNHYYDLTFMEKRGDTAFTLSPFIQMNERMGNVPEPDTRHFWNRDIYTHVTFADLRDVPDSTQWKRPLEVTLKAGEEAIVYDNFILHCDTLEVRDAVFTTDGSNIKRLNMALQLRLVAMDGSEEALLPIYSLAGDQLTQTDAVAERSGVKARFASVETEEGRFKIQLWRRSEEDQPFILIQAIAFPWINLLWLGSVLMGLGSALAVVQRVQRDREKAKKASA